MVTSASEEGPPAFVDTPYGMVTGEGRWYHIPEARVREFAGDVLDHVSLDQLVRWADAWMDSPRTVTLWALPVLLWLWPAGWAAATAVALYIVWGVFSPSLPSIDGAWIVSGLRHTVVQGLFYVGVLSALAAQEAYGAVGTGLAGFILLRWGLVDWLFRLSFRPLLRTVYPLPATDQVLRGLIVRAGIKYRESVPQVDAITKDILENWNARSDAESGGDRTTSNTDDE